MKSFAFLLIILKVFGIIRTAKLLDEYDITETLKDTIFEIFQITETQNVTKLFDIALRSGPLEQQNIGDAHDVRITHSSSDTTNLRISYEFSTKKLLLYSPKFIVNLSGDITPYINNYEFECEAHFEGCTISAFRLSSNSFLFDWQYTGRHISTTGGHMKIWRCSKKKFEDLLPGALKAHMNANEKFSQVLGEIYDHLSTKHPHFSGQEILSYYLVPNVSVASFNLKTIVLRGLTNFHSYNFTVKFHTLTHTLLIENIRGSMTLEGLVSESAISAMELRFRIDSLSIRVSQGISRPLISVQAKNYSIFETNSNTSLTEIQSYLMDHIERAIGLSLMPSVAPERTINASRYSHRSEMENSIRRLLIKKSRPIQNMNSEEPQNQRIQSEDETTLVKWPAHSITNIRTNNVYQYQISFPNVTIIQFVPGNQPLPEHFQCPISSISKLSHQLNVIPSEKPLRNSDKTNLMNIDFRFDAPSVNISTIKRNNSTGNDSCEFQISNEDGIKIFSSGPGKNATELNEQQSEMKNKLDAALMSMKSQRVVWSAKSMACLPFQVCVRSVQMVNEFFLNFLDNVLKQCSFRRNATQLDRKSSEFF